MLDGLHYTKIRFIEQNLPSNWRFLLSKFTTTCSSIQLCKTLAWYPGTRKGGKMLTIHDWQKIQLCDCHCINALIQTHDTCIQARPEIDQERENLRTYVEIKPTIITTLVWLLHQLSYQALAWEQGGRELGVCIQVLLVLMWLIYLGSPKGTLGMTCCHLWLSVRFSIYT